MGLAPYGKPSIDLSSITKPTKEGWDFNWSIIRSDPPTRSPFEPLYCRKIESLLKAPPRKPGDPVTQVHKDLARSCQLALEECVLSLLRSAKEAHPQYTRLCYAGGVALNCSANQRILRESGFDQFYVSPVSSDRGLALGCAYVGSVQLGDKPQPLEHAYQGSSYSNGEIHKELVANDIAFQELSDPIAKAAELIADAKVIGWFQGRSEAGARSLGNRSILSSAASAEMRDVVNARIKYREKFRPFAPAVLQEHAAELFDTFSVSDFPFMTVTLPVKKHKRPRLQAVTHIDGSARVQTVRNSDNQLFHGLIKKYGELSGTPSVLNTSFNLKGQPIVESPRDAIMTYFGCGLDALIMGNFLVQKSLWAQMKRAISIALVWSQFAMAEGLGTNCTGVF